MWLGLVAACVWFGLYIAAKWIWLANRQVTNRGKFAVTLFVACVVLQVTTIATLHAIYGLRDGFALSSITGLVSMGCMFVLYMPFYYTIATSISVQSLIRVLRDGGRAPRMILFEMFASRQIVSERLETMCRNGYLRNVSGTFELSPKARRIVVLFRAIKRGWKLGAGG